MMKTTTTTHRKVTAQQLSILLTLFSFRFATTNLLLHGQQKPISIQALNKRLRTLHTQNYLTKRGPDNLSFGSQSALWCLAPAGIAAIQANGTGSRQALRNLRKDAQASDKFAHHSLGIFTVHNALQAKYLGRMQFLTRSFLYGKETFPDPLPDALITIDKSNNEGPHKQFLLEYVDGTKPQQKWQQRVLQFIDYIESGEWEETDSDPALLFVCATPWLEKRVNQWIRKADADNLMEFAQVYVATIESVAEVVATAEHAKSPEARDSSRALKWEGY